MSLISNHIKEHLKEIFEKELKDEVRLVFFTQDIECEFCEEARELLQELESLSKKIKVEMYDFMKDDDKVKEYGIDKIPVIAMVGSKDYGIRFYGLPSGYEFSVFIDDLVDVSKGNSRLSEKVKARLKSINKPLHIQVFVTPTCPYCPRAIRIAHQMAMESDFIRADAVEIIEFPHLAHKYNVMSVPKIVINDALEFVGALTEEQFLEKVLSAFRTSQSQIYL
ncbi:MAG: thioredoxin family protein [archaeon]|nr:thioredoxin family protein [archaeon]